MKRMPQPVPYQGSKRNIAQQILSAFPKTVHTLIEPFAGSAAISVAAAYHKKARRFYLNDLNKPLMELLEMIINNPNEIAESYERLWKAQLGQERTFYNCIRHEFNQTQNPEYLLYLLARCVKASVRYNADGEFNQSPDNRRKGRRPVSMRQEILAVSSLLKGKVVVTSRDYREVLDVVSESDLVYMDPPYQGTSQNQDPRYYSGLDFGELVDFLGKLNKQQVSFILSYDGRTGEKTYGTKLPSTLKLKKFEIYAGRSSQSTLLGKNADTYESLYLSPALTQRLRASDNNDSISIGKSQRGIYPKQLELGIV